MMMSVGILVILVEFIIKTLTAIFTQHFKSDHDFQEDCNNS